MLEQTVFRKQLRLEARAATAIEESDKQTVMHIERLGSRRLRCSGCGRPFRHVSRRGTSNSPMADRICYDGTDIRHRRRYARDSRSPNMYFAGPWRTARVRWRSSRGVSPLSRRVASI